MLKTSFFFLFLLLVFKSGAQESMIVSGKVTDVKGSPIVGASVVVVNKHLGTATDLSGHFRLEIPEGSRYLRVSCIGFEGRRVQVRKNMEIILRMENIVLDESFVVAYGTARRGSFSGSASVLSGDQFRDRAVSVGTAPLEGLMSGVILGESNGQPGAAPSLRIRGFGSVNAGSSPVYVVDGMIYHGELCDLNPADIQSITVLKDAASASLYGLSAGNGVVLIHQNRGNASRPMLHFAMKQGFCERGIPEYDRVGIADYYPLQWEMLRNGLLSAGEEISVASTNVTRELYGKLLSNPFAGISNDEIVLANGSLNPEAKQLLYDDLDWGNYLFRKGYRGEYNVSYNARFRNSGLYVNLGYLDEQGYVVHSGLERFTARLSGDFQPFSRLKAGLDLNFSRINGDLANTRDNPSNAVNPFYFTRYIGPVFPVHVYDRDKGEYVTDALGNRIYDYSERGSVFAFNNRNIVEETLRNRDHFERNTFMGRGFAELTLWKGLAATCRIGIDSYDQRREQYELKGVASSPGRFSSSSVRGTAVTVNEFLNYQRNFSGHQVALLLGHESYDYKNESLSGTRQDQVLEDTYVMSDFLTISRLLSYTDTYRKEGYLLRVGYNYGNLYDFSVSYRRDGSSRFGRGNRWGNFWAVGASWNIGRETFLEKVSGLDYLKFRISYGKTGNDAVLRSTSLPNTYAADYYPSQSLYMLGANNALEPGIAFSGFGNPDLKWETQISFDMAVEFSCWGSLSGTVEYFRKDSRDLLFHVPQVLSSGTTSLWMNTGSVRNRGVELVLDSRLLQRGKWKWEIGINATFLHNEIISMPASQPEISDATGKLRVGVPLYNFWLKEYRGVDPETGDAQYTFDGEHYKWNSKVCFVNEAGDSLTYYSNYARYHDAGSPVPKVYGGISTRIRFLGVELSGVLSYAIGGKAYNTGYSVLMYHGKYGQAFHRDILKRWQKPGDRTDVPRLDDAVANKRLGSIQSAAQNNAVSDRWLMNAGYLNVKSVTLQYHIPRNWFKHYGITDASIYIGGENLYLLSAMKGFDPRQLFKGVISVSNTPARTFTFGLNVTL